jgi:cysteine-rich repeat protein
MNTSKLALVLAFGLFVAPSDSQAATAASADDICAPAVDPCIITSIWDVTGTLDFGSRSVSITGGGRLRGAVNLLAGKIDVSVGDGGDTTIGGTGNSIQLLARRSCSGDTTKLCVTHAHCTGFGTCSAGNTGSITVDGTVSSAGPGQADVAIGAVGDITLLRRVSSNATGIGSAAGSVFIESFQGSVLIDGQLTASGAPGSTYDGDVSTPGDIELRAALDVTLSSEARAWGPDYGGNVDVTAGRDVILNGDIVSAGGAYMYASGGYVYLDAGRDLRMIDAPGGEPIQEISTDGGGSFYFYGYGSEGGWASGYGGYQYLWADGDIEIGPNANLHSRGGPAASGGRIEFFADGEVSIQGSVYAQGTPPAHGADSGAAGGWIYVRGEQGFNLGVGGQLNVASPIGNGGITIQSGGPSRIDGTVDVRGTGTGEYIYAGPGYLDIGGNTDLTIGGKLRGGGNYYGDDDWHIDVCRLHLTATALLDTSFNNTNPNSRGLEISIGESMRADAKSRIETDPGGGTQTTIRYRDPKKPPLLAGIITPAPLLVTAPSIDGCPVCGNLEIDEGESCDDGNTVSGDGCRGDCQDEGCVAATPGFPAIPICDDGLECTKDNCNPVTHQCEHPVSCDDGVACTVDACNAGACEHVPTDALCTDGNDCTDDLCNEAAGCVFANLTGNTCEDGNFCTPPGTCDSGTCDAGPSTFTAPNSITAKALDGDANDRLKLKLELPIEAFTADPDSSGARLVLTDAADEVLHDTLLAPSGWTQTDVARWGYRDSVTGTKASVRAYDKRGTVRLTVKLGDAELGGATAQSWLSASLLFGADIDTGECVTARRVPCTSRGTSTKCAN